MATSLVTTVGLTNLLKAWAGISGGSTLAYMGVGSGTTAPALGDTALQTELDRIVNSDESASGNTLTLEAFFPTGDGNGTIAEVGVLSAAAGGDLHVHAQPDVPVVKTAGKQMRITLTIT